MSRDLSYSIVGAQGLLTGADSLMAGALQVVNLGSPSTRIGGGTDEVQLNVIGERALGLPREPDPSRELRFRDLPISGRV